jgi:uncharacterized protein DUF1996
MSRARRVLAGLMVAGALTIAAGTSISAGAPVISTGKFVSVCSFSHQAMQDPIVFPHQPGASHLHEFFGNTSTDADSTPWKLRHRPKNTCSPQADRSGYWAPALLINRKVVKPSILRAYYTSGSKNPSSIQSFPRGLDMLAGDSHATSPQPFYVTGWYCDNGPLSEVTGGRVSTPYCGSSGTLEMDVTFPDCWDGKHLDSEDHKSHLAYAKKGSPLSTYASCPPGYPVPLPKLTMKVVYPTNGARSGIELASMGIYSQHADFMNAWKASALQNLVTTCIKANIDCRNRTAPPGQATAKAASSLAQTSPSSAGPCAGQATRGRSMAARCTLRRAWAWSRSNAARGSCAPPSRVA